MNTYSIFVFLFLLPNLLWVIADNPPFQILDGDYKEKGVGDRVQQMLMKKLTGYKHETIEAHWKRAMTLAKHRLVCVSMGAMNEERSRFFISANKYAESDQLYLAVHDSKAQQLAPFVQKDGQVNIVEASKKLELITGYSGGKSYGKHIDDALINFQKRGFYFQRMAQFKMVDNMYKMFLSNRVDVFVEYRECMYYLLSLLNTKQTGIKYYPVLGAAQVQVGVLCSNSPEGKILVDNINQNLSEDVRTAAYGAYKEIFHKDPKFIKNIEERYKKKLLNSIKSIPKEIN